MPDTPLVGRGTELDTLSRWLHDSDRRAALLVGAAGVGKTRLAREFQAVASGAGMATVWAVGTRAASGLPFGALATLLPEVDSAQPDRATSRADLIRRSATGLLERAGERRLVLVVDDAHLLDDASATLIHQMVYMAPCFVLAIVRAGERPPDPVTAIWKDGLGERLDLHGLDSEAIASLLHTLLGGQVDAASAARLAAHSEGNALFLHALVRGARSDGSLRNDSGVWYLSRALSPSEQLVEVVESQIGALSSDERDALEIVSYGGPLAVEQLCAVTDPRTVEGLERKGLLVASVDSAGRELFQLDHPIYGDVLRQRMPRMRVQSVARLLASTLAAQDRGDELSLRLAVWQLDSGRAEPGIVLDGARISRWRYDFDLAYRLARAAADLGAGFEAELLTAELASLRGLPEEAESRLAALALAADCDEQRGRVACLRLDNLIISMGDKSEALRVIVDTEQSIADQFWRDQVAARRLVSTLADAGPELAVVAAPPLYARTTGSARLFAAFSAAFSLARNGQIEAALRLTDDAYRDHLELTEPMRWYPWMHLWNRCQALGAAGRFAEGAVVAEQQWQHGLVEGSPEARAWFGWYRSSTVAITGDVVAAERSSREALALFHQLGQPNLSSSVIVSLAQALALSERVGEAEALLDTDPLAAHPPLWNGVERVITRAWIAAARGDIGAACAHLLDAAELGERLGDLVGAANALHGLTRLGRPTLAHDRLAALSSRIEGDLVAAQLLHTRALHERDGEALEDASSRFAAMGARLLAAETRYDAALVWRQAGQLRHAAGVERDAEQLAAECPGVVTPALQVIEPRSQLTRSERETAMLAAAGHTNRRIADLQHLSIRTVENRLQLVYAKLGVAGRKDLSSALEVPASGTPSR